jgi:hypothetical protein
MIYEKDSGRGCMDFDYELHIFKAPEFQSIVNDDVTIFIYFSCIINIIMENIIYACVDI